KGGKGQLAASCTESTLEEGTSAWLLFQRTQRKSNLMRRQGLTKVLRLTSHSQVILLPRVELKQICLTCLEDVDLLQRYQHLG
ncbi:hypothetical protein LEMLEM_LOCUS8996, partial [Lemmus lemmus]